MNEDLSALEPEALMQRLHEIGDELRTLRHRADVAVVFGADMPAVDERRVITGEVDAVLKVFCDLAGAAQRGDISKVDA